MQLFLSEYSWGFLGNWSSCFCARSKMKFYDVFKQLREFRGETRRSRTIHHKNRDLRFRRQP